MMKAHDENVFIMSIRRFRLMMKAHDENVTATSLLFASRLLLLEARD
jgi:hypothetical protein